MKRSAFTTVVLAAFSQIAFSASADKIVILHTNDTHSQIDPDDKNLGGIARRKVLVDSVRAANRHTLLVDAGDAVQGTVYFSLFKGAAESDAMNALGYDLQIVGNHEFDNGLDEFARYWKSVNATPLATNYDFTGTPAEGIFRPWAIREIGGKRIGFIGIGLDPHGMVADANFAGMLYHDAIEAANAAAWVLKKIERVDLAVAVTHIGYGSENLASDTALARSSRDIDIIIGGHTHTSVNPMNPDGPAWMVDNADGHPVLVVQNGKAGRTLGEITIDTETGRTDYRLIPVDSRLDSRVDSSFVAMLAPYREAVDSVMAVKIGKVSSDMDRNAMTNFMADFVAEEGRRISGGEIDLAIVNKGGVRGDFHKGALTVGHVMQVFPFDNRIVVMELLGSDLLDNLKVMTHSGGNGLSREADVAFDGPDNVTRAFIGGQEIDSGKIYRVATIDYLANGGDYMSPLKRGTRVAESSSILYDDMIASFRSGAMKGRTVKPDNKVRMHRSVTP